MGSALANNEQGKLLIRAIEEKAKWLADHTFMRYPSADWENNGYLTLTWAQLASSIDKLAYWLDEKLGKATENDTVSYLGPNDLRYSVILPAVVKTGRKLLIPDGRVTDVGLAKLVEETECKAWIYADGETNCTPKTLDPSLKRLALPSIEWCLDAQNHKPYPYGKSWDEGKDDLIVIIHTSGTTGVPKPIYHTNGFHSAGQFHELSKKHWPRGIMYDTWMHKAMLSSCPPQWLGGISAFLFFPVFNDTSCIIPPADATAFSPAVFKKLLEMNMVDGIMSPPHTVVQLYNDPETQKLLKSLQYILYLGAAMDQAIGDDLAEHTKLTSIIGSTETGKQLDLLPLDRKLWHTHDYVPENGNRMIRIEGSGMAIDGSEDLYELVLQRPENGMNLYQPAFWNPQFKDLDRIETKELYAPVKDSDGRTRWVFTARKDDLTKLNWLAKFHARDIEHRIQQHQDVSSAFVGGEGRPTPYVIVEPREGVVGGERSGESLLDELYADAVMRVNETDTKEIRIPRETVFLTKQGKPFKRSHKQTLMRKEIEKDYATEIDDAYSRLAKVQA